ncbi:uncharacterized protein LOC134823842 [Bolinopsis microptera]|uniref:uncharacterized protein LOC134823842 n=1 Tax=Bolinopsis microptera TaxID=2820187 RepID=UPI00307A090F
MYANFTTNTRSDRSALTVTSSVSGRETKAVREEDKESAYHEITSEEEEPTYIENKLPEEEEPTYIENILPPVNNRDDQGLSMTTTGKESNYIDNVIYPIGESRGDTGAAETDCVYACVELGDSARFHQKRKSAEERIDQPKDIESNYVFVSEFRDCSVSEVL